MTDWKFWVEVVIAVVCLSLLLYVVFVVQPRTDKLLRNCSQQLLCKEGILTGEVCARYEPQDIFNPQPLAP